MKTINLRLKKNTVLEYLIALSFILPYLEISAIRELLGYRGSNFLIPASVFIMASIALALSTAMMLFMRKTSVRRLRTIVVLKMLLDLVILLRGLYVSQFDVFLAQYLWFVIPFYYAMIIIRFINYFNLNVSNIAKIGTGYFSFYLVMNTLINLMDYGFGLLGSGTRSRLISPGGGPVVLGYTIVLVMNFVLLNRSKMSRHRVFFSVVVLVISSILTGSRGAIWPMMLLLLLFIVTNQGARVQTMRVIFLVILVIMLNPISLVGKLVPRAMDLNDGAREITLLNGLEVFPKQPFSKMLFGTGLSSCFPYQSWLMHRYTPGILSHNVFSFNGYAMLVQPHNSFIYLLLETGLVGLVLFLAIFVTGFRIIRVNTSHNKRLKYILFSMLILLNNLDAVFIIQPGSAGLWWLLFLLAIYEGYGETCDYSSSLSVGTGHLM